MTAGNYTLTSWIPTHYDPRILTPDARPPWSEKGTEYQRTISAPNDETALNEAERILPNLGEFVVGTLKDQGGRLVVRCYTIHSMWKCAWDDPPETIDDTYSTFFAPNDEEAKKRYPAEKPYIATSKWENVSIYGPDGYVG